jgi:hypothetical protein
MEVHTLKAKDFSVDGAKRMIYTKDKETVPSCTINYMRR